MMAAVTWFPWDRTSTTIMVSPRPRPNPSSVAPRMPFRENGSSTSVTIPHRVPPRPRAASVTSRGARAMTSRVIEVTMGMMVREQMSPQANTEST